MCLAQPPRGLLVVNADDWGLRREVTDAILECHAAGAISSATAMVHMEDSARAAAAALESGLPTGLHLNFGTPFSDPETPSEVRSRQRSLVHRFSGRLRGWDPPSPSTRRAIADGIADQLAAFRRLYGGDPTHVDGHQHVQTRPAVFTSSGLDGVARLRCAHTYFGGERPAWTRLIRTVLNRRIAARFEAPDWFFSLRDMHPALGGGGLEEKLARSAGERVEVMVHAQWQEERDILLTPEWAALTGQHPLGSYGDMAQAKPTTGRLAAPTP